MGRYLYAVRLGRHDDPYVLGVLSKWQKQFPDDVFRTVELYMDATSVSGTVYVVVLR